MDQFISYFKRFRMEIDLNGLPALPPLPAGYAWLAWSEDQVETHAEVKFASFHEEIDATVFPSLGSREGCSNLMKAIRRKPGFLSGATWLVTGPDGACGTVQGVRERNGMGFIQNLGVIPRHRGMGLGSALMLKALHGFFEAGLGRAFLEVTAQNEAAVQMYRRLGFRCRKTLYKAVETVGAF